jgi:hypothetical protein
MTKKPLSDRPLFPTSVSMILLAFSPGVGPPILEGGILASPTMSQDTLISFDLYDTAPT